MKQVYWISGGSGSLGTALTLHLTKLGHHVRAFARNEHRLADLKDKLAPEFRDSLSLHPGSVEDLARIKRSMHGADFVIHAAAMKRVDSCEYSPAEAVKTNVNGTLNVLDACIDASVRRAIFVSSDKQQGPTLYGQTKSVGERLWIAGNRYCGASAGKFMAARYGNCWGSQGSVIHAFKAQAKNGRLTLTSPECTRYHWLIDDAVKFLLVTLDKAPAGSVSVPKLPSYKLGDLAAAFMNVKNITGAPEVIGLRENERLHEVMIADSESRYAQEFQNHYVLTPGEDYNSHGWSLNSGSNEWRLGRPALEKLIEESL